ncbi:MAG TPA: branched-chain amino acid ABC transporter permease [Nevskiaceae bacterium]
MASFLTVLLNGIAFGMLFFLTSVGLSVTMGLMNFINLAHGVFGMVGGYTCVVLLNRAGVPFLASLPVAIVVPTLLGVLLERTLYRRLYGKSELAQVLFSLGIVFIAIATAYYFFGPNEQSVHLPEFLKARIDVAGVAISAYSLALIAVGLIVAYGLHWSIVKTAFGAKLRAAVDNQRVARGLGINVDRIFMITFALGSALAGFGGALGIQMLGVAPEFPVTYLVFFLIVVTVGGTGNILGSLYAAILVGVVDIVGKYYIPQAGAFFIYAVMVITLVVRPQGLFGRSQGRAT